MFAELVYGVIMITFAKHKIYLKLIRLANLILVSFNISRVFQALNNGDTFVLFGTQHLFDIDMETLPKTKVGKLLQRCEAKVHLTCSG